MKTQVNLFVALLISGITLFIAVSSAPGDRMIVRISKGQAVKTLDVQVANLQKKHTRVAIQHLDGTLWFSDYISKEDGYAKRLNLTGMPDGRYLCFVSNGQTGHMQSFRMEGEAITFAGRPSGGNQGGSILIRTGYNAHPMIARINKSGDKTIQLQLANLQRQDTRIRLTTLGVGSVLDQKISGEYGYANQFNLNGMAAGAYFMSVEVGAGVLIQHFRLNNSGIQMGVLERMEPAPLKQPELAHN